MTSTTDSVVPWQNRSRAVMLALAACLGATLAGCGSTNILGSNSSNATTTALAPPVQARPQLPPPISQSRLAIAPVVGAPDAVGKQLSGLLSSSLQRQRVVMASSTDKPDYTLRGYMVAAKDKAGVKISYIWDLTDPGGKRANRIQGEEIARGANSREPWKALSPSMMQTIADKTSASLAASLASLAPTVARSSGPVGVGAPTRTAGAAISGATTGSLPRAAAAPVASARSTGVIVPSITGAPGDGNASLLSAMQREMQQAGLATSQAGQSAYKVTGKVTMGRPTGGKQTIKIDWKVSDPLGSVLATVTQNNEIQAGQLDSKWGGTATDAAQGAAIKIKTLIEQHRTASARGAAAAGRVASRTR